MKLQGLTEELAEDLWAAWEKGWNLQPDFARSWEYFAHVLLESDSEWYQIDGFRSWFYITGITPGGEATLHALNLDGAKALPAARSELQVIMNDFSLHRLTVVLPGPPTKLHRAVKHLGFRKEGRMREALLYDGRPADAVIYGILRREVEHDPEAPPLRPKRRRRRRSRRKKENQWVSKVQSEAVWPDSAAVKEAEASLVSAEHSGISKRALETYRTSTPSPELSAGKPSNGSATSWGLDSLPTLVE